MELVVVGILAGVAGTLAMDLLNHLVARTGAVAKVDVVGIGRMAAGWTRGRFRYRHPDEMSEAANEMALGYVAHHAIGVGLAIPFVLGWEALVGGLPPAPWAVAYGLGTTVASFFFVYPSLGLGACGRRSPDRARAFVTPLANHLFYGVGLAAGIELAARIGLA